MLVLENGTKYTGGFKNGLFHGKGVLQVGNGKVEGEFENGRYKNGQLTFSDGLKYEPEQWRYLKGTDRRFHIEKVKGGSGAIQPIHQVIKHRKLSVLQTNLDKDD